MLASLIAAVLITNAPDVRSAPEFGRLRGTWVADAIERDGEKDPNDVRFTFDGRAVTVGGGGGYVWQARLDPTRQPREIDFTRPASAREKASDRALGVKEPREWVLLRGIYVLDGDALTVCVSSPSTEAGGKYRASVRPAEFATRRDDNRQLYRLKRAAKKD